eukprot:GHVU01209219.1.p3 GENE.GHVU01209219.1~~GHVU01209219.1.p3  ORF type:complete len:111 (-),score=0.87 GHVU01209219.1:452-784(-)
MRACLRACDGRSFLPRTPLEIETARRWLLRITAVDGWLAGCCGSCSSQGGGGAHRSIVLACSCPAPVRVAAIRLTGEGGALAPCVCVCVCPRGGVDACVYDKSDGRVLIQ